MHRPADPSDHLRREPLQIDEQELLREREKFRQEPVAGKAPRIIGNGRIGRVKPGGHQPVTWQHHGLGVGGAVGDHHTQASREQQFVEFEHRLPRLGMEMQPQRFERHLADADVAGKRLDRQ